MVVLLTSACGSHTSVPLLFPLSSPITSPPPPALATLHLSLPGAASAAAAWPPRASAPAHGRHCASRPRPGEAPCAPPCGNRRRQWAGSGGVGRRAPRACLAGGRSSAAGTQGRRPCLGPSWGWVRSLAGRRPEFRHREAGASPRRPTSALSAGGMAGACPVCHRGVWASPRRPPGPYQGAWPELRRREAGAPPPPGPCLGAWPELHRR
ncbi:hypothetical protein PVAP13_7KG202040 [Panicum virgatum]|uniref:Uncharacterized protein n=1 Tax=Panicum virgatum TaxID=38727 RepID=A0A8T0QN96_PANVG|nr:hypothetical protein PVAP13_7KG202040 [Panicum virgatum]